MVRATVPARVAIVATASPVIAVTLLGYPLREVVAAVARVAAERGTTYVLLGAPAPASGLGRLREPLAMRLVRALPGIDVRLVADRGRKVRP